MHDNTLHQNKETSGLKQENYSKEELKTNDNNIYKTGRLTNDKTGVETNMNQNQIHVLLTKLLICVINKT